jgi:cytochrome c5
MKHRLHALLLSSAVVLLIGAALLVQCSAPEATSTPTAERAAAPMADTAAVAAWSVVYGVLQHPRCMNCHPVNDAPLQGDQSLPHAQNVQRGKDGHGLFAMRCETCHQTQNLPVRTCPPGASQLAPSEQGHAAGLRGPELGRALSPAARSRAQRRQDSRAALRAHGPTTRS